MIFCNAKPGELWALWIKTKCLKFAFLKPIIDAVTKLYNQREPF